jgi:predicted transcriptional regulator of viral defense system
MVMKTEALYEALLPMKVASFNDIMQEASKIIKASPNRRYIYRKYVTKLVKRNRLRGIRKGLYLVLSPLEKPEKYVPDKLLIAAKIKQEYYLGYHTALEYYGCAQSLWNEAYICIKPKDRFDPFKYKRLSFKPVFTNDTTTEIQQKHYLSTTIKVSSKERTMTDCLTKIQYAGGWEEAIKSLEGLGGINTEKLLTLLRKQKSQTTIRRTGYTLELLRKRSQFYEQVNDQTLNTIQKLIKGPPQYLIYGEKGPLNKKWSLYIPEDFEDRLRGI